MKSIYIGTGIVGSDISADIAIDAEARARHVYTIGQTGTGKSVLLENMIAQDMRNGAGLCFIDPHGTSAEALITKIPPERKDDLIFLDLSEAAQPVGLNFMTGIVENDRALWANNLVAAFKHIYGDDSWGPRMEYIFVQSVRSLMDSDLTLLALPRLFTDEAFRNIVIRRVRDPFVKYQFWREQFGPWSKKFGPELTSPIDNKVGTFLSSPQIRAIVSQRQNTIDLRQIMDQRKILIVALRKGRIGEMPASLMGAVLVSAIAQTAMSRLDNTTDESALVPFALYCDEFQNYATSGFPLILSEARKFKLMLTLAHQGLSQIPERVMNSVFDNCGTLISFRIGVNDAPLIAKAFNVQSESAFLGLPNFQARLRPLERGNPADAILVHTYPPPEPLHGRTREFIAHSGRRFGRGLAAVSAAIERFLRRIS
jgi:Type IV secretion-system coupling protein DNA-binding domain